MNTLGSKVGRPFDCALVFNDSAPDWASWEDPWFEHHADPDYNWAKWVAAAPGRQLIITQNLFPASVNEGDWRRAGADGAYVAHAKALATNLVQHGLGESVIRLAHEANGTWYPDSVGSGPSDYALWVKFWRLTAQAMRSVRGAYFTFDWCVNAVYRNIPLDQYYPGDDVVDIVGIDAYDTAVSGSDDRWTTILQRPMGIDAVRKFAAAHGKPLSIPEWGLAPSGAKFEGGDDDPQYVTGIADVVKNNPVAYQSYFYRYEYASTLDRSPNSLAAYRAAFGSGGFAVGTASITTVTAPRVIALPLPLLRNGIQTRWRPRR